MSDAEPSPPARSTGEPAGPWFEELSTPASREPVLLDWPPKEGKKRQAASPLRSAIEWVAVIAGALLVAILIRTLFVQTFYIPSESMEPTLVKRDRVLVNKLSYKLHDIHRGDVVVFKRPPGENDPEIKDLIKRVIGLPGETVEGRDGHILIDNRLLTENYIDPANVTSDFGPTKVPPGMIFVMGDNRDNSKDSRMFGPVDKHLVVGRAFVKIWPFGRLGWL